MTKHSPPLPKRRDLVLPALMPTGRSGEKLCIRLNFPSGLALLEYICYNMAIRQGLGVSGGEDFL